MFRNEAFIFDNPMIFPERLGPNGYFAGKGEIIELRPGRHQWETNFVADITNFELKSWAARGKNSSSLRWIFSDGTLGCHTSQIVSGTYKRRIAMRAAPTSLPSTAAAIPCFGMKTKKTITCVSTGTMASSLRRRRKCFTSISILETGRHAISLSSSARCAIRSGRSKRIHGAARSTRRSKTAATRSNTKISCRGSTNCGSGKWTGTARARKWVKYSTKDKSAPAAD